MEPQQPAPTLPKLTAKVLESEVIENYSSSPKSRKKKQQQVKKKDIGWPTDFRHSSHIGFMSNNNTGVVQIEVDGGKFVYVDTNTMERIQDSNLSSPILEGREWAVDAPPASVSPPRRPRPKRTPVLADTSEKLFAQPVSSVDSPTTDAPEKHTSANPPIRPPPPIYDSTPVTSFPIYDNPPSNLPPPIYENIPISSKRLPAPPPPKTKKPALKPVPPPPIEDEHDEIADDDSWEFDSFKDETNEKIAKIEVKINKLTEELDNLRKEKATLLVEVEAKELERKYMKQQQKSATTRTSTNNSEYEPYIQAHIIENRMSSRSSGGLSTDNEICSSLNTPEPDDEPHSPIWDDGLPEIIKKVSIPSSEKEIVVVQKEEKVLSLEREKELEKEEIEAIKQFNESISLTAEKKVEILKPMEPPLPPTKDTTGRPIPPPRKKVSKSPAMVEKPAPRIHKLHKSSDSEVVRL